MSYPFKTSPLEPYLTKYRELILVEDGLYSQFSGAILARKNTWFPYMDATTTLIGYIKCMLKD